jgi:thioredoxin-like negative regulator of GroEL
MFERALPWYILLLIIVLCALVVSNKEGLTPQTADINKGTYFILLFTKTCQYCKELVPVWGEAMKQSNGKMMAVNCTEQTPAIKKMLSHTKTTSFPRMIVLKDGVVVDEYEGNRSVEDILAFFREKVEAADSSSDVNTEIQETVPDIG